MLNSSLSLKNLCTPRESIFGNDFTEDIIDLQDLSENKLDGEEFFENTYITAGMEKLFEDTFNRYTLGGSGIIRLTQSMGGGKTHNMVALGLLAESPSLRKKILGDKFKNFDKKVKVIAFTGRESDSKFGIWGEIARQLGKVEQYSAYYSSGFKAPGQSTWVEMLKGEPILILLDELPPYLENAKSVMVGTSDLSQVTITALSNLFSAVNKSDLSNVTIVISDLKATYEEGSQLIQQTFKNLDGELSRSAINIEPVGSNSDDLYNILKKRLFTELPDKEKVSEIAKLYREEISKLKQMNLTTTSPDEIYSGIKDSYPFHPSIKNIFARFKENPGFQQTRGFIRLVRMMIKDMYESESSNERYLINAYDMDLNNPDMLSLIKGINDKLTIAITHDIADDGKAIAETLDIEKNSDLIQKVSKLLLISSLSLIPSSTKGLKNPEIVGGIAEPGLELSTYKSEFDNFIGRAWYLYKTIDGNFFFKDIKNYIAELNSRVDGYDIDSAKKRIGERLKTLFAPKKKDVYQTLYVFPAIDEINLDRDRVSLVIYEPSRPGEGLHNDLANYYENQMLKNRLMFLSGQRGSMNRLLALAKEDMAIESIIKSYEEDGLPDSDVQFQQAKNHAERTKAGILNAAKETFVTLYYPKGSDLISEDFRMEFSNNNYVGEEQIRALLMDTKKFESDVFENNVKTDTFRKKFESRVFTTNAMRWNDLLSRSAEETKWTWYPPDTLNKLKKWAIEMNYWKEEGGYLSKGPFPEPKTAVSLNVKSELNNGEVILRVVPQYGEKVYYDIDSDPTTASSEVEDINSFKTDELEVRFLCVDPTGKHETGDINIWRNIPKIKYDLISKGNKKQLELFALPKSSILEIKYTTDGSNPKEHGAVYVEPVLLPENCDTVCAIAESKKYNLTSEKLEIKIPKNSGPKVKLFDKISRDYPLTITKNEKLNSSQETYRCIDLFEKYCVKTSGNTIYIKGNDNNEKWGQIELGTDVELNMQDLKKLIDVIRDQISNENINVSLRYTKAKFEKGSDFIRWTKDAEKDIESYEGHTKQ